MHSAGNGATNECRALTATYVPHYESLHWKDIRIGSRLLEFFSNWPAFLLAKESSCCFFPLSPSPPLCLSDFSRTCTHPHAYSLTYTCRNTHARPHFSSWSLHLDKIERTALITAAPPWHLSVLCIFVCKHFRFGSWVQLWKFVIKAVTCA